ncbi:hypothetical protein RB653_000650 [Dictyostelium firmibasis]|uniref:Uncharacterized protein n=1 Tax=Dictyostelium firmibasis TaxID=79012 RepID=A0AAN7U315_9MYCE
MVKSSKVSILILLLVVIIGCFCLTNGAPTTNKQPTASEKKLLNDLYEKAKKAGGIVEFKSNLESKKFVTAQNRPYDLLALFTSSNPKYGCGGCVQLKGQIESFSNSYEPYLNSAKFLEKPIFIVILEVDYNMEVFQTVGLNTIPHLLFIPSGSKQITQKGYAFTGFEQISAQSISDFIYGHSKIRIEPIKTFYEKHSAQILTIVVILASVRFLLTAYRKRKNPMFWYFLTILLFSCVIMGIFYDFIHKPNFYEFDHRHQTYNYFSRGSRSQTVSEGMIMGVSTIAITLIFVYISDILPNFSTFSSRSKGLLFFIGMSSILVLLFFQSLAFQIKYYRPLFFIPSVTYHY